jgi:hypothetical protein
MRQGSPAGIRLGRIIEITKWMCRAELVRVLPELRRIVVLVPVVHDHRAGQVVKTRMGALRARGGVHFPAAAANRVLVVLGEFRCDEERRQEASAQLFLASFEPVKVSLEM